MKSSAIVRWFIVPAQGCLFDYKLPHRGYFAFVSLEVVERVGSY